MIAFFSGSMADRNSLPLSSRPSRQRFFANSALKETYRKDRKGFAKYAK